MQAHADHGREAIPKNRNCFFPLYFSIGLTTIASVLMIFVKEGRADRTDDFELNRQEGKERMP